MKYFSRTLIFLIAVFIIVTPVVTHALSFNIWEGTTATSSYRNADGTLTTNTVTCNVTGGCDFCDALRVFQNIIDVLFQIAIPLAVIFIVYGGIRLMTSGGSEQGVSAAKEIIKSAVIGLVIALSAWIIINVIISLIATASFDGVNFIDSWSNINCI